MRTRMFFYVFFILIIHLRFFSSFFFFFNDTAPTEIYTLSLHDALPISRTSRCAIPPWPALLPLQSPRSEEHTSELQSRGHLVCRLLLEKKKKTKKLKMTAEKKKKKNNKAKKTNTI